MYRDRKGFGLRRSTITAFTSQFDLPAIGYTRGALSASNPGLNDTAAESELDLEWSHVAAPRASINRYFGSDLSSNIGAAVTADTYGVISIGHGFCGASSSFMKNTLDLIFLQAAAQGQSVFVSSGDQGGGWDRVQCEWDCMRRQQHAFG